MGHHLWGGECAPEAGELQGQAAAVQARLKVQTQRDLLMDQMPCQGLKGRVGVTKGSGPFPFCLQAVGEANHPQLSGNWPKYEKLEGLTALPEGRYPVTDSLTFKPDHPLPRVPRLASLPGWPP